MASNCKVCSVRHTPHCSTPTRDATWPTAPLLKIVGGPANLARNVGTDCKGIPEFVGDRQADSMAVACGLHPEMVWPGWCEAGLTDRDRRFVNEGGWRQSWLHLERLRAAAVEVAA